MRMGLAPAQQTAPTRPSFLVRCTLHRKMGEEVAVLRRFRCNGLLGTSLPKVFESQSVRDDDQVAPLFSTLAIAAMVFQLRVVAGTPKTRSNVPR